MTGGRGGGEKMASLSPKTSKIATAQTKIRHLLDELNELSSVLGSASGATTPEVSLRPRGPTPKTVRDHKANPKNKNKRISPVLLPSNRANIFRTTPKQPGSAVSKLHRGGGAENAKVATLDSPAERSYAGLRREKERAEAECERLRLERDQLRRQVKNHRSDRDDAICKFRALRGEVSKHEEVNELLRRQCASSDARCRHLKNKVIVCDREMKFLREKNEELNKRQTELELEASEFRRDQAYSLAEGVGALREARRRAADQTEREADAMAEAEVLQDSLADLEIQVCLLTECLKVSLRERDEEIARLKDDRGSSETSQRVKQLEAVVQAREEEVRRCHAGIAEIGAITDEMESKKEEIRREVAQTQMANAKLQAQVRARDREVRNLRARMRRAGIPG